MPEPDPRVMAILAEALALSDTAARAAYLDRACGCNAAHRASVEALLGAHSATAGFVDPDTTSALVVPLPTDATGAYAPGAPAAPGP
ncbi:MAG: hypothetical protein FJ304_02410 [Planctomycetes bacterium]|nr:hypothetical protein [Planctomycetota bacterium]